MAVATAKMIENGGIQSLAFRDRIGMFFYISISYVITGWQRAF
jgi:hypothetical protein